MRQVGEARRHPRRGRHLALSQARTASSAPRVGEATTDGVVLKLRRAHLPATPSGRTGTTPYLSWSVVRASAPRNCGHHCPWQVSRSYVSTCTCACACNMCMHMCMRCNM